MPAIQGKDGRFLHSAIPWDASHWDSGYIDNKGRFRVYRPDYPRAYKEGYALRAHVVWWLHTGMVHPVGTNIHHKNEIKFDDSFENLECKTVTQHLGDHFQKLYEFTCGNCQKQFWVTGDALGKRRREGKLPIYCSQKCSRSAPRSIAHNQAISDGLKLAYKEGRR